MFCFAVRLLLYIGCWVELRRTLTRCLYDYVLNTNTTHPRRNLASTLLILCYKNLHIFIRVTTGTRRPGVSSLAKEAPRHYAWNFVTRDNHTKKRAYILFLFLFSFSFVFVFTQLTKKRHIHCGSRNSFSSGNQRGKSVNMRHVFSWYVEDGDVVGRDRERESQVVFFLEVHLRGKTPSLSLANLT